MAEVMWELPSGQVQAIEFDVVEREVHDASATITEDQVEEGANTSDHVRPNHDRLSLDVVVSNQPIVVPKTQVPGLTGGVRGLEFERAGVVFARAQALVFDEEFDRARTVYEELTGLKDRGDVLTVITKIREYQNMVIERIGAIVEAATGDALISTVDFRGIRIVETEIVETDLARANTRANRGRENPSDASDNETRRGQTIGYQIGVYLADAFGTNVPPPPPPPPTAGGGI